MPTDLISFGTPWYRKPGLNDATFVAIGRGGDGADGDTSTGGGGGSGGQKAATAETVLDDEYNFDTSSGQAYIYRGNLGGSPVRICKAATGVDASGATGGVGASDTGEGDVVTDGDPGGDGQSVDDGGAPGDGGNAGDGSGSENGGAGGTGFSSGVGQDPGGGGQGGRGDAVSPSGKGSGGAPAGYAIYTVGILDVPTQPANANSGDVLSTFTARISDWTNTPDTDADSAPAGNSCTLTLISGPGAITAGTTSRAYGTGADGSTADFDDIVISGATGVYQFRITDDVTGVTVDTATFTITATAGSPALLLLGVG